MVFYAAFNSISVISRRQLTLFMSFLGFTSTRLGSEMSCQRTLPRKNPEDLVRLEPRTPGLQVKHFTTEPRGTLCNNVESGVKRHSINQSVNRHLHELLPSVNTLGRLLSPEQIDMLQIFFPCRCNLHFLINCFVL